MMKFGDASMAVTFGDTFQWASDRAKMPSLRPGIPNTSFEQLVQQKFFWCSGSSMLQGAQTFAVAHKMPPSSLVSPCVLVMQGEESSVSQV